MQKQLLILITLLVLTNISYASFPVLENASNKALETINSINYGNSKPIFGILSLSFALLSFFLIPNFTIILILALLSAVLAIIGLITSEPNAMEIIGIILAVIMTIISGSIVFLKAAFKDA